MAKASIKVRMPDDLFIGLFDTIATQLGRHNKTEAHFRLPEPLPPEAPFTQLHITFEGRGFVYKKGALVEGIITKVIYEDEDGIDFAVYTGLNANVAKANPTGNGLGLQDFFLKGNDTVTGSREADILYGGPGNDTIKGLNGDDIIMGGRGNDTLTGNLGEDSFSFVAGNGSIGKDVITDFQAGVVTAAGFFQDLMLVSELPDLNKMRQVGANTVIDMGDGFSITLLGIDKDDITADDFDVLL